MEDIPAKKYQSCGKSAKINEDFTWFVHWWSIFGCRSVANSITAVTSLPAQIAAAFVGPTFALATALAVVNLVVVGFCLKYEHKHME